MNICVFTDLRFTTFPQPTGVGKHILQMVTGLSRKPGNMLRLLTSIDQRQAKGSLSFLSRTSLPFPWRLGDAVWTAIGLPYADAWCDHADWIYCPKNDFIPVRRTRVAVTIHGAHELDPVLPQARTVPARLNRLRRRTAYRRMLNQAHLVLTVSEFLKRQMIEWFEVEPDKCCVVGNGVESEFFAQSEVFHEASCEASDRPFVLSVGGLNYLDGGDRILRLASVLRRKAPDLSILVAGSQHENDLRTAVADLPNVRLLGYVRSERLRHYFRDSLALYYPTRYETFGIAAAEAMATGTPVVTSRTAAVPEVVGEAGIYVDPDNPEEAVEALLCLQQRPGLRTDLICRGRLRAEAFRWEACVARLQKALETA